MASTPLGYLGDLGEVAVNAWAYAGLVLMVNNAGVRLAGVQLRPAWFLAAARWLYHEIRPFYWPSATMAIVSNHLEKPEPLWTAMSAGAAVWIWYLIKDVDDEDDRWKRRRRKVAEKVAVVAGRLQVVPAH